MVQDVSTVDGEPPYFAFCATLRISGQIEDFDAISQELDLSPTHTHNRGTKKSPSSSVTFADDLWSYTAPVPEDRPLDEHILALWDSIKSRQAYLHELKRTLRVDVFCGYRTNHWSAGFQVEPTSLEIFTALEIPFGVSVIVT